MKKLCKYCDYESFYNEIFQDYLTNDWYLNVKTPYWNEMDDDFEYIQLYIKYCPYCGRNLYES